jgi:predicted nucleic acid-binding protein
VVRRNPLQRHRRVLVDTSVWIYHLEQHEQLAGPAATVLTAIEDGELEGVASELTLLELTARPLQLRRQDVADAYELLLDQFPNLELRPVDREVLIAAARLRAQYRLRTPDAIVLATGLQHGATAAVTNDAAWRRVGGIEAVLLSEIAIDR